MAESAIVPSGEVRSFRDLKLWQEAMDFAVLIHQAATALPVSEHTTRTRAATLVPNKGAC